MKDLFWWLVSLLFAATIFGTEVFNCSWSTDGEYSCELIQSEKPKEVKQDVYVFEPSEIDQYEQDKSFEE